MELERLVYRVREEFREMPGRNRVLRWTESGAVTRGDLTYRLE